MKNKCYRQKVTFTNNASYRSHISKINYTFGDNAEHLDTAMPINNLLEYSDNYSMTFWILWNYYRDDRNNSANKNNDTNNYRTNNNKTTKSKSFEYRTQLIGRTPNNNRRLNAEIVISLKYLKWESSWHKLSQKLCNIRIIKDT